MREYFEQRRIAAIALAVALVSTSAPANAQSDKARLVMGLSLTSLRTDHPEGGELAVGAVLGVERQMSPSTSLRAAVTASRVIMSADNISLCHPTPEGCLPDAVFPRSLFGLSLDASVAPKSSWPVRLLGGLGGHLTTDPAEKGGTRSSASGSRFTAHWRFGIEVPLGSSRNASIVQVGRTGFARSQFSVPGVDALTLMYRDELGPSR
jgi:hypothetical protein